MTFIDSHCHLPNLRHKEELEKILADAKSQEVTQFINIGTSIKENAEAIEVAENYGDVFVSVAIYPHEHQKENIGQLLERLEEQAKSFKRVVAIGECGIDITEWKNQRPVEEQVQLFKAQINLAQKLNLPLIIHNRNGNDVILQILSDHYKNNPRTTGVVHCFDSTWKIAQQFLDFGFYLSFSGLITYPLRENLLEVVKNIPSDKYLIETDAPFLLPEPAKSEARVRAVSQKNEPKYVRMVGQKVAEIRQISLDEVAYQTSTNTRRLFNLAT